MRFDINDTILGKNASTTENPEHYGIHDANVPFVGFDVWNCYELSFLTDNGLPISRVMKMIYPADSPFLVESKSLKLYLNAFNMDCFGKTIAEAKKRVADTITSDLSSLLQTEVRVILFDAASPVLEAFPKLKNADLAGQ